MFCYQQNFFTATREVSRDVFWALVRAPYTAECIDKFRETGDAAWKKRLPAFIFQATFDKTPSKRGTEGAWRKQAATRLTGLVVMDVDHVGEPKAIHDSWLKVHDFKALGIVLIYITPSGRGLKIVFKARTEWGNLIDNQHRMAEALGVTVDESCKDASRMSFICKDTDILYINEEELFDYENKTFSERYTALYRDGHSQATDTGVLTPDTIPADDPTPDPIPADAPTRSLSPTGAGNAVPAFKGVPYSDIIDAWWQQQGGVPQEGERNVKLYQLAVNLRAICDNDRSLLMRVMPRLGLPEEELARIIESACKEPPKGVSKAMQRVIGVPTPNPSPTGAGNACGGSATGAGNACGGSATGAGNSHFSVLSSHLSDWGETIRELAADYPCMQEAMGTLPVAGYAAGLFTTAALLGTLMTRTWYRFYHRPEELRRLNYCIMVIGDPASGKSFATRLYKLLAAPIKTADKVGYDAINRYKEEMRTKSANKEKPKKPVVVIRDHPARTSNATFIQDMNNAVETVDGEPMHLHMLTFDSELDNATLTQRGGSWIDKSSMELKAFHNEEDGQAYSNLDSVSGTFNVYWNYVYTGTPLSLQRKVTERNFGSGLATRLAVIPLPPSGFKMMELATEQRTDREADERLKAWAYKLDDVKGELPLWPLVEEAWQWTAERMEVAAFNEDKADELLLKRVAYYGIGVAAPFVVMRHWDEWQQQKTLAIDDTDRRLCRLAMDIQYRCQHYFFGAHAQAYFDNMERDQQQNRRRQSRYDRCYEQLPQEFTVTDIESCYGVNNQTARTTASRLLKAGTVERIKQGEYRKIKKSLM